MWTNKVLYHSGQEIVVQVKLHHILVLMDPVLQPPISVQLVHTGVAITLCVSKAKLSAML